MEEEIGKITHYFSKINVGVLEITKGKVQVGDTLHIKGHTTDYYQKIQSMQVEHAPVELAEEGMQVYEAGAFVTEEPGMNRLKHQLSLQFTDLKIDYTKSEQVTKILTKS